MKVFDLFYGTFDLFNIQSSKSSSSHGPYQTVKRLVFSIMNSFREKCSYYMIKRGKTIIDFCDHFLNKQLSTFQITLMGSSSKIPDFLDNH